MIGFGIVVLMHLILGWALVNGLARKVVEVIKGPIETKIIEEVKPPPPPPENLPPPPKFAPPPPSFVPPPEVVVNQPTPAPTITTTTVAPPPAPVTIAPAPAPAAPAPAAAPSAAPPRLFTADAKQCAPTADDYPPAAIKSEATGSSLIRFTVDATGKVVGSEVVRSAGPTREHRLLDRVAITKFSECKFQPGRDAAGNAVGGTVPVEYVWKLN